jgi:trehalose 6-phosphate synthase
MNRLVVVSNRLPDVRPAPTLGGPETPAGGLVSALLSALRQASESVWFGWNGRSLEVAANEPLVRRTVDGVSFVGLPLTRVEVNDYYYGYCNDTLWPLFHCFQGRIRIRPEQELCYRAVQRRFAAALIPLLRSGDLVWVHDYHMLLLGRELRRAGWTGRLAFFLHIPFPPPELWQLLPDPADFSEALLDYDLVGFHVRRSAANYLQAGRQHAEWDGTSLRRGERSQRVAVYPAGIDPEEFLPQEADLRRCRQRETLGRVVGDRRILVGVDRLDYTKGIVERLLGFEEFLRKSPSWRNRVVFLQVAAPSRTQLPAYREEKARVESLISRINGELGEHDWMPVRYLHRSYSHEFLARIYREADAALVTPLRDGMNLVAKEFVAAQDPANPGVLVLSRTAGAAEELGESVLVNPFVPPDIARGIREALEMPILERQNRHAALLSRVLSGTADGWCRNLLADLRELPEINSVETSSP